MKIYFVTGNKGKYLEVKEVMNQYNIKVEHLDIDKPEIKAETIEEIAKDAAEKLAKKLKKTIVCEDTGLFFKAYHNFPGPHPKFVYEAIGFEGIFKLLEGKTREAYFMTVAAYCEPGKKAKTFEGMVEGTIAERITKKIFHVQLPYDQIFIPKGYDKPWAEIIEIKKGDSHRVRAFKKLAEWLSKK